MAELEDALVCDTSDREVMWVRIPPGARHYQQSRSGLMFSRTLDHELPASIAFHRVADEQFRHGKARRVFLRAWRLCAVSGGLRPIDVLSVQLP